MRKSSKIFCSLLAALSVLVMSFPFSGIKADNEMSAAFQAESINIGWNLGNTLDSYGTWITNVTPQAVETAWGNPVTTRQMIASVRARGFNTIRIPVTWAQFTDDSGNVSEEWMLRVHEVVDWALDEGLYVILNVHHDTGEHGPDKVCWLIADTGSYESVRNRFITLWTSIANEFKDYDNRLMFEGYNEMLDINNSWNAPTAGNGAYDAVNMMAQDFVDTVRESGGSNSTRNLIVNTYVASPDSSVLDSFVLPQDSAEGHLIVEVHAYTPWRFCSHEGDASYTAFDSDCQNEIDNLMTNLSRFKSAAGVPVIIGEFGVENQNNDSDRAAYAAYYVRTASSYGIKCIWWDNGISEYGGYGIFDRNTLSFNEEITAALIDNASEGAQSEAFVQDDSDPGVTEASEEARESFETGESSQTAESVYVTDPVVAYEVTEASEVSSDEVSERISSNFDNNQKYRIILTVSAVVLIAAVYTALFFLGRSNGRKS